MAWGFNPDCCQHGKELNMCSECEKEKNEQRQRQQSELVQDFDDYSLNIDGCV